MDKEKTIEELQLVEISEPALALLPENIKYLRHEDGKIYLSPESKTKEEAPPQKKETFAFEDSMNGFRIILDSDNQTMDELIIKAEIVKNKFLVRDRLRFPTSLSG